MGSLVTKLTTNNVELDESGFSDVVFTQQVEKTPAASGQQQTRTGLLKNLLNFDPRSPSMFITRTPIAMFRNNSASKFNHKELNESIESQVDLDILTQEEEDSLGSCTDIAQPAASVAIDGKEFNLPDPRSPITELVRTPIIAVDETKKKRKEESLVKQLADKLVTTAVTADEPDKTEVITKKEKKTKNLIYQDDENNERYSTPPKKVTAVLKDGPVRTPLSCVANTPKSKNMISTSTPKSKNFYHDHDGKSSRIPVSSARKLH